MMKPKASPVRKPAKRGRGRPPKPPETRRRNTLAVRANDALKSALEAEAELNQRSLSEELEMRLELSVRAAEDTYQHLDLACGRQAAGLLLILARVVGETSRAAGFATNYSLNATTNWLDDPYAYSEVTKGIYAVLEILRPQGEIQAPHKGAILPSGVDLGRLLNELGTGFATTALTAVAGEPITDELSHWSSKVRERLGSDAVDLIRERAPPVNAPARQKTRAKAPAAAKRA